MRHHTFLSLPSLLDSLIFVVGLVLAVMLTIRLVRGLASSPPGMLLIGGFAGGISLIIGGLAQVIGFNNQFEPSHLGMVVSMTFYISMLRTTWALLLIYLLKLLLKPDTAWLASAERITSAVHLSVVALMLLGFSGQFVPLYWAGLVSH